MQQAQHAEQAQAMAMQGMEPGQVDVGGPPQGGSMPATPGVSEELLNAGGGAEVPPQAPMQ